MRFLLLIPFLLFGGVDIDEHTKKWINPEKKYEISGQHILNTINTIDSLENVTDSLSKYINFIDNNYDWYYDYSHIDATDTLTLYDTVYFNSIDTLYDTAYVDRPVTQSQTNNTRRFIIIAAMLLFFMAAMGYVSSREYKKK